MADDNYFFCRRKAVSLFIFILFLTSCSLTAFAQDINNLYLEKVQEEGLSNNYVYCIQQDADGFIWFGTGEGLFRFDGYGYKAFRNIPGDTTTLAHNSIEFLYPDGRKLWIATKGNLSCIDIDSQKILNFLPKGLHVLSIAPRDSSSFWLAAAGGLFQFDKRVAKLTRVPGLPESMVIGSITDDTNGHLYLTSPNGFYCFTVATGVFKHYDPPIARFPDFDKNRSGNFYRSVLDGRGNLWLGTWGSGLVRFNIKTEKIDVWSHPTNDVHLLPYKIVSALLPDASGDIWLANKEGGLTIFNPAKNKFINYPVDWRSENKISGSVVALFRDRSGIVWIGTENGVFKSDPHHANLSKTDVLLKTDSGFVPSHISPLSMLKEKNGLWWMGMYEGIFVYDQKKSTLIDYNKVLGLPESYPVFNIVRDNDGAIWLTSRNLLVKVSGEDGRNPASVKAEIYTSPDIKSTITALYTDKENRMWIGTHSDGVFRFDPAQKKFISYHFTQRNIFNKLKEIDAFRELSKDSLLIGGYTTGLLLMHIGSGTIEKIQRKGYDNAISINSIYRNIKNIWLGTESNGLWRTDVQFKPPIIETVNDGLPSMNVGSIMPGRQNDLWLLSNSGLVNFGLSGKKITVFDKKDGLHDLNQLYAMIMDDGGNIFIGGRGCVYNFNPLHIIKNIQPPKVLITDLKIFDKAYNVRKGEAIKLSYNQNYFTLGYVALNYTQSAFNRYAYKMDGLDNKWIDAGSNRSVSYANLDEGTYTFKVRACNNEGVWNNVPAKLVLIIVPPFWHRWWFYTLFILLIVCSIYFIYWYNMNQLKMRVQLRNKIARDLHDDIGSTLSGINIFTKIALQKLRRNEAGSTELLEKISDRSERTMDALSDIVWSISTKNDLIDNFLVKAREYLAETLESQGIRYDMHIAEDISHLKLGMELTKEFYLIFKEAICNASKYAQCTLVEICLPIPNTRVLSTINSLPATLMFWPATCWFTILVRWS